ncbi:MAG TPA: class I SAM-dependent methyltransferase [Candidatus Saccharimonadales bacterium]|nr:class I SAM-dependent methyltransferase [Candidatus Saccharimonadales bacterium]
MTQDNCYQDALRAQAYARLEFPGTYYLAYRDLPELFRRHVRGRRAVDFGCGAGRSTRFLRRLGFEAVGIDISADMLDRAREIDPAGDYRRVENDALAGLGQGAFDLVLSAFTFDSIPTLERKAAVLRGLAALLGPGGRIVNLVSAPEIYVHEWASFSTRDYPENRAARCGDPVRIVITDIEDPRPVEDVLWTDAGYREAYARAGVEVVAEHRPLAREDEPHAWVNETRIPPWVIYVLGRPGEAGRGDK